MRENPILVIGAAAGLALAVGSIGTWAQGPSAGPWPNAPLAGKAQYALGIASATTLTVPSGATYGVVCVEGANARYTVDGTTPTSSVGMPLLQNQCVALQTAPTLNKFQAIQQTATATLDVTYYQ